MRKSLVERVDQLEYIAQNADRVARWRNAPPLSREERDQNLTVWERLAFMNALDLGLAQDDAGNLRILEDGRFVASCEE